MVANTPSDDGGGGDGTFLEPFTTTNVMEHRRPVSAAGAILTTLTDTDTANLRR